ncbi:MAG: type II toxin-antitoxin system Phd/YefM family antitoxin, partial [Pirellulales bacterium]
MTIISIEEAQANLAEIIHRLLPGEEVTITNLGQPVAQVRKAAEDSASQSWPCRAGSYAKPEFWMSPDFDAPLDDDPVVAEIHRIRAEMLADCGGDFDKLRQKIREDQAGSGCVIIEAPGRSGGAPPTVGLTEVHSPVVER